MIVATSAASLVAHRPAPGAAFRLLPVDAGGADPATFSSPCVLVTRSHRDARGALEGAHARRACARGHVAAGPAALTGAAVVAPSPMRRRILYIGNFGPSFSTENHVGESLRELGVEVVQAQENAFTLQELDGMARDVDLLLYTRTWGLRGDALRWITQLPIPTASYHLDLYAGLSRGRDLRLDPFWRTQHVFTPDGGSEAFFRAQGIRHHYLKPGVYGAECYLADVDPGVAADVCFVGSYDYHPEWPYRRRLVDFLSETYGRRFAARWGNT